MHVQTLLFYSFLFALFWQVFLKNNLKQKFSYSLFFQAEKKHCPISLFWCLFETILILINLSKKDKTFTDEPSLPNCYFWRKVGHSFRIMGIFTLQLIISNRKCYISKTISFIEGSEMFSFASMAISCMK